MASVSQRANGSRFIQFTDAKGRRRTVHLGRTPQRHCEAIARHVTALYYTSVNGQPPERGTADWLKDIGDKLHKKLADVGLVAPRQTAAEPELPKLDAFITGYIARRTDA